ncbi:hypothetical protein LTR62_006359 [Meristemomyces frigidus]|uniref:Uncharacterized protein n=1 Tax=Meristemomyces frigidus TaxID=1508187 RepID=A0AAN7TJY7_9PEZI|nr:hypothetical protein LTR62_006359 [Meristemomyces frigidus]
MTTQQEGPHDFCALQEEEEAAHGTSDIPTLLNQLTRNDRRPPLPTSQSASTSTPDTLQPSDDDGWSTVTRKRVHATPANTIATNPQQITEAVNSPAWNCANWRERKDSVAQTTHSHTPSGVMHSSLIPGTIVCLDDNLPESDSKVLKDGNGVVLRNTEGRRQWVKNRYWLIVRSSAENICDVPIYSNNDTGLQNVGTKYQKEYFSLRPVGVVREPKSK